MKQETILTYLLLLEHIQTAKDPTEAICKQFHKFDACSPTVSVNMLSVDILLTRTGG